MALALRRQVGERVCIEGSIVIEVARIDEGGVTLAIEAPDTVSIWREELGGPIQRKGRKGSEGDGTQA